MDTQAVPGEPQKGLAEPAITIRHATPDDVNALASVEAASFPTAEACSHASFQRRVAAYPAHFWLLEADGALASFVNGMCTDEPNLRDEMYDDASLHDESGRWQMIFGVATDPAWRRRGFAGRLLERAVADAREQGRSGLVLTCKERLLPYYAKFGFRDEGVSGSEHGGVTWHQMRLTL